MPYSNTRDCPLCKSKCLTNLSCHLTQVHHLDTAEKRQPYLKMASDMLYQDMDTTDSDSDEEENSDSNDSSHGNDDDDDDDDDDDEGIWIDMLDEIDAEIPWQNEDLRIKALMKKYSVLLQDIILPMNRSSYHKDLIFDLEKHLKRYDEAEAINRTLMLNKKLFQEMLKLKDELEEM